MGVYTIECKNTKNYRFNKYFFQHVRELTKIKTGALGSQSELFLNQNEKNEKEFFSQSELKEQKELFFNQNEKNKKSFFSQSELKEQKELFFNQNEKNEKSFFSQSELKERKEFFSQSDCKRL